MAQGIPSTQTAGVGIAASDGEVGAGFDFGPEQRQQFGRMLQIGIHHGDERSAGFGPAAQDGAGETLLAAADDEADARIGNGELGNEVFDTVAAVVVHYNHFKRSTTGFKRSANASEQRADVAGFAQGRDDEREPGRGRRLCPA